MSIASSSRSTLRCILGRSGVVKSVHSSTRSASSSSATAPIDPSSALNAHTSIPSPPVPSAPSSPQNSSPTSSTSTSTSNLLSFPPLEPLPRPTGTHVATLRLASYHPSSLTLFTSFALASAHSLGIPTSGAASLPTVTSLYTVPKSPFVHKKSQENFHRKEHKRAIKVFDAGRDSVDLWLRYLRKHSVGGVGMRAEVYEWVGVGQVGKEMGDLEGELKGGKVGTEVKEKAEELVKDLQT